MNRAIAETTLHRLAEAHVGRPVGGCEAIYREAGLNGADFYEFMVAVDEALPLPPFRWDQYADMNEPPDGLTLFGRLRILPRQRLTISHMTECIVSGSWFDPVL